METKKTHLISMSLPVLQNVLKRDPDSYKEEFLSKYEECKSMLNVFQLRCSSHNEALVSSISFISQVVHCYKTTIPEVQEFPEQLIHILRTHGSDLDADMRMTFCKALISLRNNGVLLPMVLLDVFFQLFSCPDKVLRKMMYNYVVQDIKNVNTRQKNVQLNKALQNYMYKWMDHNSHVVNKMCLDVMVELYRRKIWNDDRTVNVIAKSLSSKNVKVLVTGVKFFLGVDKTDADESDSDDDEAPKKSLKELVLGHRVGKHSKKRQKRLERAKTALEKHKKKHKPDPLNFSAIHLLNDPQELAEKLLDRVMSKTKNEKFEVRLLILNFVSRLIGLHELIVLKFYEQLKLFLKPSQSEVTKLLLYVAQASHELVPPEELEVVISTIASNFITERNADEVIAVGLNAVREICARCPLAMSKDLLDDLVEYKTSKDKGVMMAARSLITLYRQKNPQLLHKSNRGRPTEAMQETRVLEYGQRDVKDYIPGAEVLSESEEVPDQKNQDEWESCSEEEEENDSDGSWVDIHHSSDEETENTPDNPTTIAENIEKAKSVTHSRILTNEDFNKIKLRQVVKEVDGKGSKKRSFTQMEEEGVSSKEIIPLENIELVYKKRCHDRKARMATVLAGREGRGKFGHREKRMNPHASTSNKDKRKTKAFTMVKHKIREKKGKRSFQEKSKALKHALLRKLKAKK